MQTTIPYSSDAELELEHEMLLLKCMDRKDYVLLASLASSEVEGEYSEIVITDPRPTVRLDKA